MWKKFLSLWIARYEFSNSQKSFFWPYKKHRSCTSQAHICMNAQNSGASVDSFFKASWLSGWKISNHLEFYNI